MFNKMNLLRAKSRAKFFLEQPMWNPQFRRAVFQAFLVHKVFCQPDVTKYDLFHFQVQVVEHTVDFDARHLRVDVTVFGL